MDSWKTERLVPPSVLQGRGIRPTNGLSDHQFGSKESTELKILFREAVLEALDSRILAMPELENVEIDFQKLKHMEKKIQSYRGKISISQLLNIFKSTFHEIIYRIRATPLKKIFSCKYNEQIEFKINSNLMSTILLSLERLCRLISIKYTIGALARFFILNCSKNFNDHDKLIFNQFIKDTNSYITFIAVESKDIPTKFNVEDFSEIKYPSIMTIKELILLTYDTERNNVRHELFSLISINSNSSNYSILEIYLSTVSLLNLTGFVEKIILQRCRTLVDIRINSLSLLNFDTKSSLLPFDIKQKMYSMKNVFANFVFRFTISILLKWAFKLGKLLNIQNNSDRNHELIHNCITNIFCKKINSIINESINDYDIKFCSEDESLESLLNLQRLWVRELISYAKDRYIESKLNEIFEIILQFSLGKNYVSILLDIRKCMEIGEEFYQKIDNALFAKLAFQDFENYSQQTSYKNDRRRDSIASINFIPMMKDALKNGDKNVIIDGKSVDISGSRWSSSCFTSSYANNKAQSLIRFRKQIVNILITDMKNKLLHAGIPTSQIINFMIAMEESLKFLDPSSNLFLQVYTDIQVYLKTNRPNSIEIILEQLIIQLKRGLNDNKDKGNKDRLVKKSKKDKNILFIDSKIPNIEIDEIKSARENNKYNNFDTPPDFKSNQSYLTNIHLTDNEIETDLFKHTPSNNNNNFNIFNKNDEADVNSHELEVSYLEEIAFESVLNDEVNDIEDEDNKNNNFNTHNSIMVTPHLGGTLKRGISTLSLLDDDNDDEIDKKSIIFDTSTPLAAISRYGSLNNLQESPRIPNNIVDSDVNITTSRRNSLTPLLAGKKLINMSVDELVAFQIHHRDNSKNDDILLNDLTFKDNQNNGNNFDYDSDVEEQMIKLNHQRSNNITFEQVAAISIRDHITATASGVLALTDLESLGIKELRQKSSLMELDKSEKEKLNKLKKNIDYYFKYWKPGSIDSIGNSGSFDLANRLISMVDKKSLFIKTEEKRLLIQLLSCLDITKNDNILKIISVDNLYSEDNDEDLNNNNLSYRFGKNYDKKFKDISFNENNLFFNRNSPNRNTNNIDNSSELESPLRPARFLWNTPGKVKSNPFINSLSSLTKKHKKNNSEGTESKVDANKLVFNISEIELELDLLKKRLKDMDFNNCDVMIWDINNSRKINLSWRSELIILFNRLNKIYKFLKSAENYMDNSNDIYDKRSFEDNLYNEDDEEDDEEISFYRNGKNIKTHYKSKSKLKAKFKNMPISINKNDNVYKSKILYSEIFNKVPVFISYIISELFWPLKESEYGIPNSNTNKIQVGKLNQNKLITEGNIRWKSKVFNNNNKEELDMEKNKMNIIENKKEKQIVNKKRLNQIDFEFRLPCEILREKELYSLFFKSSYGNKKQNLNYIYNLGSVDLKLEFLEPNKEHNKVFKCINNVTEIQSTVLYFANLLFKFGSISLNGIDHIKEYDVDNREIDDDAGNLWPNGPKEYNLIEALKIGSNVGKLNKINGLHQSGVITLIETLSYYNNERHRIFTLLKEWIFNNNTGKKERPFRYDEEIEGLKSQLVFNIQSIVDILSEIPERKNSKDSNNNSKNNLDENNNDKDKDTDKDNEMNMESHLNNNINQSNESLEAGNIILKKIDYNDNNYKLLYNLIKTSFKFWESKGIFKKVIINVNEENEENEFYYITKYLPEELL